MIGGTGTVRVGKEEIRRAELGRWEKVLILGDYLGSQESRRGGD